MPKDRSMKRRMRGLWSYAVSCAIVLALTGSICFAQQQTAKTSPKGTKYLLYTPPNYSPSGSYPLLIVLHGQGGLGDNLNLLLNKDEIPSRLINEGRWPSTYPFIVVTPQLKRDPSIPEPEDQEWPPEMIDEVVGHVRSGYAVNANKVYITGLSQGSHGSYDYTAAFPSKIAAAVYISGAPDSTIACQVKNVPIWVFHGTDDSLVPTVFAKGLIRALDDCSPAGKARAKLTMMQGRRHEGWNEVYNNSSGFNIYEWMLKFTKNSASNTPPYVNAGRDLTIAQREGSLHVYAEVFDSDGAVSNISWSQVGGGNITMSQTNSAFLKLTNLTTGTFEFDIAATDNNGAQARDRVKITIVAKGSTAPAVTGITLINASTRQPIASLYDGYVVNPKTQARYINLEATVRGNVGSVVYKISGNHNARTTGTSPYPLASPRWTPDGGDYLVCATPFAGAGGTGPAGISQCFKLVVSTTATPPPPPEDEPPTEEPPAEEPPVEEPPVEEPPVEEPPAEEPPAEEPPAEEPPVEEPPVEEPPAEEPPAEEPPVEEPPAEEPPVEEPPAEEPPVEEPPVEEPPAEEPPVEEPPAEEPPAEEPPAEEPPAEEPPVEEPPVEEPPATPPPVYEPPVEESPITGILENARGEIHFYPNPASESITVDVRLATTEKLYYFVANNIGEIVESGEFQGTGPSGSWQLGVRHYPAGIYFLNLRGADWRYQHKFIVGSR